MSNKDKKKKIGKEAFFTRTKANKGVRIPLVLPTGEETGEWLQVASIQSDVYRKVSTEERRKAVEAAMQKEDYEFDEIGINSALVIDWSFDEECTRENVAAFLEEAPQIADKINQVAMDNKRFFGNTPTQQSTGSDKKQT